MIPEELAGFLSEFDPEDIKISLRQVNFMEENISLDLTFAQTAFYNNEQTPIVQHWELKLLYVLELNLSAKVNYQFEILEDHPLLYKHKYLQSSLYFSEPAKDVDPLILDLYKGYQKVYGTLCGLSDYINSELHLASILKARSALLASGPMPLLQEFSLILDKHQIKHTILPGRRPTYWNGHTHVDTIEKLKLLIMEDTYFVMEDYSFNKVPLT